MHYLVSLALHIRLPTLQIENIQQLQEAHATLSFLNTYQQSESIHVAFVHLTRFSLAHFDIGNRSAVSEGTEHSTW